jgi:four helix bundle protein
LPALKEPIKSYTELEVWKAARKLAVSVYSSTQPFPTEEKYGLASQMRRAAASIPSNIAEGCGRSGIKDTLHFLFIARGSLYELEAQGYIASDLGYFNESVLHTVLSEVAETRKLLSGFIRYYGNLLETRQ